MKPQLPQPAYAQRRMAILKDIAQQFIIASGALTGAGGGYRLHGKVAGRWLPVGWTGVYVIEPGAKRGRCIGAVRLMTEELPFECAAA